MRTLSLAQPGERLSLLCLGAHSDDIEIGAGATILGLIAKGVRLDVYWAVLSAVGPRAGEARASAEAFLKGAARSEIELRDFKDSYFPYQGAEIKAWFADLRQRCNPDLIMTHAKDDAHQDHREVRAHTTTTFRDHLTLAYEIPKWDGDLGRPNLYISASADVMARKIELLHRHFATQRGKDWFDGETFRGLARLRGMECRAPERFAEAFHVTKMSVA